RSPCMPRDVACVLQRKENIGRQLALHREVPRLNIGCRLIRRQAQENAARSKSDVLVLRGIVVRKRTDSRRKPAATGKIGPWIGDRGCAAGTNRGVVAEWRSDVRIEVELTIYEVIRDPVRTAYRHLAIAFGIVTETESRSEGLPVPVHAGTI